MDILVAATSNQYGSIYTSKDYGRSWQQTSAPNAYWRAVAVSSDGRLIAAGSLQKGLYISRNGGESWILSLDKRDTTTIAATA